MEIFDVYMSIGWGCRPAHQLRINGLRDETFPLDWMDAPLEATIHLYETGFKDYFKSIKEEGEGDEKSRRVIDVDNRIISLHHFPKRKSLIKGHEQFLGMSEFIYDNLNARLKNAENIFLLSYWTYPIYDLEDFVIRFSKVYANKKILLVNVRNNNQLNADTIIEESKIITKDIKIIDYTINDTYDENGKEYDWKGNNAAWKKILESYGNRRIYEVVQEYKNSDSPVIIYGAGQMCKTILGIFEKYSFKPDGIAVTKMEGNPENICGIPVKEIDEFGLDSNIIISIKTKEIVKSIKCDLMNKGYKRIGVIDKALIME